jgi:hypothetical protein
LCPVYKKGDKLDCKNYRGICLLKLTYKVFAKFLYDRLLPHANAAVEHYHAEFQSGKSTTDQLFALCQILAKCNEFNITTHHLFIDFKATYARRNQGRLKSRWVDGVNSDSLALGVRDWTHCAQDSQL